MEDIRSVLIVEDETPFRQLVHKRLSRKGDVVDSFESTEEALAVLNRHSFDIALVDIKLPGMDGIELLKRIKEKNGSTEVIIITGHGKIDSAIAAMKHGAYDYLTKPCKLHELEVVVQKAFEKKKLLETSIRLKDELKLKTNYDEIIGKSEKMQRVMNLVGRVAKSEANVLIEGETGTGKELIAHAIHIKSKRRNKAFIVVHCNAFPESLLESELFGHEKGAFTGAIKQKRGLVELANHGTLFIDEVGEMNISLQVKLLRFIETNKFRRLGDENERQIDVRVIAATNRKLINEVERGHFREDLYYRLKVVKIELPPLRDRLEDIPLLITYYLKKKKSNKKMAKSIITELKKYNWPGNIRELANVIEMATIISTGKYISLEDMHMQGPARGEMEIKSLAEMERLHITKALASYDGNKTKTAKILGIGLRTLYRKMEQYNLRSDKG